MSLGGVGDGLQLQGGEDSAVDDALRQGEAVKDVGRLHAGQGAGLHHLVRVLNADVHWTQRKPRSNVTLPPKMSRMDTL